jgi:hypothetical protein
VSADVADRGLERPRIVLDQRHAAQNLHERDRCAEAHSRRLLGALLLTGAARPDLHLTLLQRCPDPAWNTAGVAMKFP